MSGDSGASPKPGLSDDRIKRILRMLISAKGINAASKAWRRRSRRRVRRAGASWLRLAATCHRPPCGPSRVLENRCRSRGRFLRHGWPVVTLYGHRITSASRIRRRPTLGNASSGPRAGSVTHAADRSLHVREPIPWARPSADPLPSVRPSAHTLDGRPSRPALDRNRRGPIPMRHSLPERPKRPLPVVPHQRRRPAGEPRAGRQRPP